MRLFAIALVLITPTLVSAQTMAAPKPPKEKKICRDDAPTGSLLVKRTCHSKSEWAAIDAANEQANQAYRDHRSGGTPPS